jgi:hypothetical protein
MESWSGDHLFHFAKHFVLCQSCLSFCRVRKEFNKTPKVKNYLIFDANASLKQAPLRLYNVLSSVTSDFFESIDFPDILWSFGTRFC